MVGMSTAHTSSTLPPTPTIDPVLLARLRDDLASARYTADGIDEILSAPAQAALERENPIPALRELDPLAERGAASATLMRLFTLGRTATRTELDRALPHVRTEGLLALGLVWEVGSEKSDATSAFTATFDLRPYQATDDFGDILWWIVSDLGELATGRALEGEHVLGIGGATSTLIAITPRAKVTRALDLGTGCGIQALHAARHATHVVATDISERALTLTEFNVALNRDTLPAGHVIETRKGSMLEPVSGETFDLIVSNPPFVITPRVAGAETWTYRDGGAEGDTLVANLLSEIDDYLAPGGIAAMLANWEITAGAEWDARPRTWLGNSSASALIVQRDIEDPASYASTWLRDGGVTDRDERWAPMTNAWLDDFASRNVAGIGFGHVLLTKPRDGEKRFEHYAFIETTGSGPLGPRYAEMLRARAHLAQLDDATLGELVLARADDVIERRHYTPGDEDPMVIDLVQGGGFGRTLQIDTHTAAIVGPLTGEYPLSVFLTAYASLLEAADQAEHAEAARDAIMRTTRTLVEWGFLHIVEQPKAA